MNVFTKTIVAFVLVVSLFTSACWGGGPLSKLDSTLDFAPLFFQGLVISGAIDQTQADRYKQGVDRFESVADTTKSCLSADSKPDAECYLDMSNSIRTAINEFFPATNNSKVNEFAALINDIVTLIIRKNVPTIGAPPPTEAQLESKIDELERLLKSK